MNEYNKTAATSEKRLSRKILAKIEGRFEEYVQDALKQFLTLLNKTYGKGTFKRCEAIVNSLMRRL